MGYLGIWRLAGLFPTARSRIAALVVYAAVPFGIVGGRIYHVISSPDAYFGAGGEPWKAFAIWEGGLVFHGGLIAALATAFILMRRYKMPWLPTFDALAVGTPLGVTFGRIGWSVRTGKLRHHP